MRFRALRDIAAEGRRKPKWILAAALVVIVILALQQVVIFLFPGENLYFRNPYPKLWPSWSAVSAYEPSQEAWNQLGPNSGATDLVVVDPSSPGTVFAAGRFMGIYRSSDNGSTWRDVGNAIGQYYVTSLVVNGAIKGEVFAVVGGSLFRSEDEGANWTVVPACNRNATSYFIDTRNSKTSYLTCGGTLLVSKDGANTWSPSIPQSGLQSLVSIAESGTTLYLMGVDSGLQFVVLRSDDSGFSWKSYGTGWSAGGVILRASLAADPRNSSIVLANAPQGIALSDDSGKKWTTVMNASYGVTGGFVSFDPNNGSVYAGRVQLYRSDDLGATFEPVGSWNIDCLTTPVPVYHADIGSLAFLGRKTLLMATDGGIDISRDGGSTWACSPTGMTTALTYDAQVDPFDPSHIIATRQDYYPTQSYDFGKTWQTIYAIQSEWGSVRFDPVDKGIVYVASGGGVWKSNDSGLTFALARQGLPTIPFPSSPRLAMDYSNPRTLWLSLGGFGLYKSDDAASSWRRITQLSESAQVDGRRSVAYAVANNGTIGGVWRTTDGGGSWALVNLPRTEQYYEAKVDPNNSSILYVVGSSLHISEDGGKTFRSVAVPPSLSQAQVGTFGPSPYTLLVQRMGNLSRIVLAAARFGYKADIYLSTDQGQSWKSILGNLGSTMILGISYNPSYPLQLYLATFGEGVLSERVEVPITLAYTVGGVRAAFAQPTLTYTSFGERRLLTMGQNGGTFLVDWGTFWILSAPPTAPPYMGRWLANETTAGIATVPESLAILYNYTEATESQ